MKRREFIQKSSLAVIPFFISHPLSRFSRKKHVYPTIIIGTGYGAGVAALRLAEKGMPVLMLEMGHDWSKLKTPFAKMTRPSKFSAWMRKKSIAPFGNIFRFKKKYPGVLDRQDYDNIKVYVGRGVGGGSLVNGGMAVMPRQEDFAEIFPQLDVKLFYKKYFPLASKMLQVNNIGDAFYQETPYYHFSRVGQQQAEQAGFKTRFIPNVYDFKYMEKEASGEVPQSALDGEVIYGNNYGKQSLDKTYLKQALATGLVTILPLHKVDLIKEKPHGGYELEVQQLNAEGVPLAQKIFHCKNLFLGAGSLGSTSLLVKSKTLSSLSKLNDEVGQHWGNNGNVMTGRNFVRGGVHRKQSCIPVVSIDNRNDPTNYFLSEIAPLPMNLETWTTLYLLITRAKSDGFFYFDKELNKVKLSWSNTNASELRARAKSFVRSMNKACGGTRAHLLFKNGIGENICYHPLGGIVLGKATDHFGRLKGYPNLYVTDSSLIPGGIGANPFLTITALAEYCMEGILAEDFG